MNEDFAIQLFEDKKVRIVWDAEKEKYYGMNTDEYKRNKGLTKQNLRDNMTNVELALNTLAEVGYHGVFSPI